MKTLAFTFALSPVLGRPGVVRTDWIAEQAQQAANDLSDQYFALEYQQAANDLCDEYRAQYDHYLAAVGRAVENANAVDRAASARARKDARNERDRARRATKRLAA